MCISANMLYYRTIAHSVRERGGVLLRGDPSQVEINQLSIAKAAVQRRTTRMWTCHTRTWLSAAAAAAGRQGGSVVGTGGKHALCSAAVLSVVCAVFRRKKMVPVRTIMKGQKYDDISAVPGGPRSSRTVHGEVARG